MELSKRETNIIKGLAILLLVFLHLFNTRDYSNIQSIFIVNNTPIEYYISLVSEACVSIFLFCSGYGLAIINEQKSICVKDNIMRTLKLLINYWIILIVFVIIGYLLGDSRYPGSIKEFLLNFFLLSKSYNGSWWFLQTYIILVILSKNIIEIVKKSNTLYIFLFSGVVYFIGFLQSIKGSIDVGNNELLSIILNLGTNFAICQFSFIVGIVFIKENIISKIRNRLKTKKHNNIIACLLVFFIFAMNIIIENWIIGPITATFIIIIFSITKLHKSIELFLNYMSIHSTNIWLTHMFFYMIFFSELVYAPKYSLIIFIWLIMLCIGTSYIINAIYNSIIKLIYYKKQKTKLVDV